MSAAREGLLMSQEGKWRTAILAALCEADRIIPFLHFAQQLGRPLTKAETAAMRRAVHSLERRGDVVVTHTSVGEGMPRRLVVSTPEGRAGSAQ
jgi:hypothetical protein